MTSRVGEGAPEHGFLSIREVLDLLVAEFPDVTISKIRFLESRGLIHPERTASGYRKFYESDVERLRWILRQQREHFLPLKVIKGRLEQVGGATNGPIAPSLFDGDFADPPDEARTLVGAGTTRRAASHAAASAEKGDPSEFDEFFEGRDEDDLPTRPLDGNLVERPAASAAGPDGGTASGAGAGEADQPATTRRRATRVSRVETTPVVDEANAAAKAAGTKTAARRVGGRPPRGGSSGAGGRVTSYSAEELATVAGVEAGIVAELDEYGLIGTVEVAGGRAYRPDALEIVRLAAAFGKFGIEPRHLRTFKHAAEREAGLFSQVVTPLLYQRNTEARVRALAELRRLVELGASLHEAFVRAVLDDLGRG
ncbi:MAG: MerR family transcriptional regulator [Acidimicrobiales bacterium]